MNASAGVGTAPDGGEGAGEVRAADDRVAGDRGDLLPGDVGAELPHPVDHRPRAVDAVIADLGRLGAQGRVLRVEEVGKQVHAAAVELAGQLHARDQGQAVGQRGTGLGDARLGVMVGQRHHVEPGGRGAAHHLGRVVGTVRGVAVHVQVNTHGGHRSRVGAYLGRAAAGNSAPNGTSSSCSGSRRSRSGNGSTSSVPAVSGHSTSHTQLAATSPTKTAFPSDSTSQSGAS